MALKTRKKVDLDKDVLTLALERIRYCYQRFDKVVVSFSGGKDSTAVLNLCIHVAREMGRLPVEAVFFDEEAIHPPTVEYVERVAKHPDVRLAWYCLPVVHRNACSNEEPWWTCWDPAARDRWVRPMPEGAITSHPRFKTGQSFQVFCAQMFEPSEGNVCMLQGLRGQESLRRMRVMLGKKHDNYIQLGDGDNYFAAHPIYDWNSEDVWRLVAEWGIDYNRTYDIFNKTALHGKLLHQRVCPPYGEEPLRGLWIYAECWPEMWHKMLHRVKGVATAWRYANTELYSYGTAKPADLTWEQFTHISASYYEGEDAVEVRKLIEAMKQEHANKTDDPLLEEQAHPLSGMSWKFISQCVTRGDFKGRKRGMAKQHALTAAKKMGITLEEAQQRHGKKTTAR